MAVREREGLIARIRHIRRVFAEADKHASASTRGADEHPSAITRGGTEPGLDVLEARIAHLEQLVEGLQDSVHRESTRLSRRMGELEARLQPSALSKSLSKDARDRGL